MVELIVKLATIYDSDNLTNNKLYYGYYSHFIIGICLKFKVIPPQLAVVLDTILKVSMLN